MLQLHMADITIARLVPTLCLKHHLQSPTPVSQAQVSLTDGVIIETNSKWSCDDGYSAWSAETC